MADSESFSLDDVVELVGVPPEIIRTWSQEFDLAHDSDGCREFNADEVAFLAETRTAVGAKRLALSWIRR